MPLLLLLALVIGGILGIALLLHRLGLTAPARLASRADAMAAWRRHAPDAPPPVAIHLSDDARAALIEHPGGVGLVWAVGGDTAARTLTGWGVEETEHGLRFRLGDPGAPPLDLALSEEARARWTDTIRRHHP